MIKPRPADDAKYMKLFLPGLPNHKKRKYEMIAKLDLTNFLLEISQLLSVSVTELPSVDNLPNCILLSNEVNVFFKVFFAGFESSLLEQSLKSSLHWPKVFS